jgi:predicted nucleotidyltransferase component of viral defense system
MRIPLSKRLRKRVHIELAMLQDEVIEIFYSLCGASEPVLHGGTAIWRCYDGARFSEYLDFYGDVPDGFELALVRTLGSRGLALAKYKAAPNVIFAKISNGTVTVKLEITRRKPPEKILKRYEKTDGGSLDIYTLSPETLIEEKMAAYRGRRFIRDIYDIYHLSNHTERRDIKGLRGFLAGIEAPVDERNLRALVYTGIAPSFNEMVSALRRRFG